MPSEKKSRALPFQATRDHHATESAEDYTELIADLIERSGEARTCEIAGELGVSHVTALRTMQRLQEQGYLKTAPHQPVVLTTKGKKTAAHAKQRHELLLEFFRSLGVPNDVAEIDVEGVEHHMSDITMNCIRKFLNSR